MEITAAQVKALRDRTGAGMMECKRALTTANGDPAEAFFGSAWDAKVPALPLVGGLGLGDNIGRLLIGSGEDGCGLPARRKKRR